MTTGWKKTTHRESDVLRMLAQLGRAKAPYLRRVVDFLCDLWETVENNPRLSVRLTMTDGLRVYHDDRCLFYMHIDRTHWALLFLDEEHLFYGLDANRQIFRQETKNGSHPEMWQLMEPEEFEYLIELVREFPSSLDSE